MPSGKPVVLSVNELVNKAREAINRSRAELRKFRRQLQHIEDRQVEIRSRRESFLALAEKSEIDLAKICRLSLGNMPRDESETLHT